MGLDRRLECPNCGASVALTGTRAAATCPCWASAIQQDDIRAAPGRAPIDGIVALAVHPRQAQDVIERWVRSRWLRPGSFYLRKSRGPLVTMYLPYLAVNAETETRYAGDRATDITFSQHGRA